MLALRNTILTIQGGQTSGVILSFTPPELLSSAEALINRYSRVRSNLIISSVFINVLKSPFSYY